MIMSLGYTGTVQKVENDFVYLQLNAENSEQISTVIPATLLPCVVTIGDSVYIRKNEETTEIRCSEFSTVESNTSSVDVMINPTTGEIQYIIQDIKIQLEE
jgi:hypothetical protein